VKHVPFVPGSSTIACYPPKLNYARSMLSLYKPTRCFNSIGGIDPVGHFLAMVRKYSGTGMGFLVRYELAMQNAITKRPHYEPTQAKTATNPEEMTEEDKEREQLTTLHDNNVDADTNPQDGDFEFGLNHTWDSEKPLEGVSAN